MPKNKFLAGLALLVFGGLIGSLWQARYDASYYHRLLKAKETAVVSPAATQISLMIDDGELAPFASKLEFKAKQTLFELTKQVAQEKNLSFDYKDYGTMGYLITQIGEEKNGQDGKYWQYWINNEQVQEAANKYEIKAGDVIMWKFAKSRS